MRNQELAANKHQFLVLAVDRDETLAQSLADESKAFGYPETSGFAAAGSISHIMSEPPHILLCDFDAPTEIEDYLTAVRDASPETLVILLTRADQQLLAFELIEKGLAYDSVVRPLVSPLELSQKMDRAASELFHLFETEQLRVFLTKKKAPGEPSDDSALNDYLARSATTKDLDETIQIFLETLSVEWAGKPVFYFKYLPSHASLPLAQAAGTGVERYRGLGLDLKKEGVSQLNEFFRQPEKSEALISFAIEVLQTREFTAFAHSNDGEMLGLFVALKAASGDFENPHSRPLALKSIFELVYKRNLTLKEKHTLDVSDPLTGLLNRRHFTQKLEEEISRARRILMPLSLITIDCDQFHKVNEKLGFQQADAILKAVAGILKKTTRVSDLMARTGPDEFTLLLPHTGHTGAAIKAERLRRLVQSTRFPLLGGESGSLTISCGVSEYPSLAGDAEGLLQSADEALTQVRAGGNKVCLATPAPDFRMDFTPREVPAEESVRKR